MNKKVKLRMSRLAACGALIKQAADTPVGTPLPDFITLEGELVEECGVCFGVCKGHDWEEPATAGECCAPFIFGRKGTCSIHGRCSQAEKGDHKHNWYFKSGETIRCLDCGYISPQSPKELPVSEPQAIYGTHYHCKKCGAEMTPVKRLKYHTRTGVSCIHVCPRDNTQFTETEY